MVGPSWGRDPKLERVLKVWSKEHERVFILVIVS